MKSLLTTLFSMFLFLNICSSQVIYVYNADEWELNNAINTANNGDTIMFDLPSYPATINIMSGYIIANKSISIIGPQNASVTLEGYADQFMASQIFYLYNNAEIELKNLTITRQSGGGNNSGQQGLIYNGAILHINNCLLYNVADTSSQGSVIYNAWAGNLFIKNSTFSENYGGQGGAIYSTGNLEIESCTFYENHADNVGGGIFWHSNGGYFKSKNSIYYNSTCFKYSNIINSLGYNLSNDGSYGFNACTDFNNVSSLFLNQLQDNGGPTHTHSLGDCSIALNNGDPNITDNDQRGLPVYGGIKDIGAFEEQTNLLNIAQGIDTRIECNSYTWIDGNTYTSDNNCRRHILVGGAANGCDSIVTLDLTIVNSATGTDTRTECNSYTWIDGNNYTASNNSATFNIVGGAANGCDSLVTLDLTINSVSDLTTSTSGATITSNNSSATYQWLDCDNNNAVIISETGQSYTALTNGNYAVELTENGCVDTAACVAITTVAIIENNFGDVLSVYPNPTNGNFSIDLGSVYESTIVSITDLSGKLIASKAISQSQVLNLSIEEPAGIYILSVQTGEKLAVVRLVKE